MPTPTSKIKPGRFVLATANPHKLEEVRQILSPFRIDLQGLVEFPEIPPLAETGTTYEENALQKAEAVARILGIPALADDSGLEIDALNGQPGVFSSRYLGETTSYEMKNRKILERLNQVPDERRGARYVCAAALAIPGGSTRVARAEARGRIAFSPKGSHGFGYDPIFYLPELKKTMAELSGEKKNAISHRGKAFRLLFEGLGYANAV